PNRRALALHSAAGDLAPPKTALIYFSHQRTVLPSLTHSPPVKPSCLPDLLPKSVRRCISCSGIMAFRSSAMRFISRRFSSGGKVLGEEEKAAENVYIKKKEQEKLEKLARKGRQPEQALQQLMPQLPLLLL
ncbi:unnamed protein product, partial [Linum tenue]